MCVVFVFSVVPYSSFVSHVRFVGVRYGLLVANPAFIGLIHMPVYQNIFQHFTAEESYVAVK
jgi:hypothetical protein